jgi:hypothetical protein
MELLIPVDGDMRMVALLLVGLEVGVCGGDSCSSSREGLMSANSCAWGSGDTFAWGSCY